MPRCFMAKKLKYPYTEWKAENDKVTESSSTVTSEVNKMDNEEEVKAEVNNAKRFSDESRSPSPADEDEEDDLIDVVGDGNKKESSSDVTKVEQPVPTSGFKPVISKRSTAAASLIIPRPVFSSGRVINTALEPPPHVVRPKPEPVTAFAPVPQPHIPVPLPPVHYTLPTVPLQVHQPPPTAHLLGFRYQIPTSIYQNDSLSLTPPPEAGFNNNNQIKRDGIFRPYCLDEPQKIASSVASALPQFPTFAPPQIGLPFQHRNIEDINTAHAILDLSRNSRRRSLEEAHAEDSSAVVDLSKPKKSKLETENQKPKDLTVKKAKSKKSNKSSPKVQSKVNLLEPSPLLSPALSSTSSSSSSSPAVITPAPPPADPSVSSVGAMTFKINNGKTTAYTYEAFFASDGRSKKKIPTIESPPDGSNIIIPTPPALPAPASPATPEDSATSSNKPRYTCSECGKNYATSSNLSRHKQTHRPLDSNSAKKCHICNKMYVSMPALSMHILTHNLNHKCDVCGKAFSRPWLLQGHMRSHSGDKPYGCAHCGKSFADRSNLRAHMQTHSAFKNFKCKRCNKSFALKSYLNKHYESACFKDQPIPEIPDTPPCTPAPSFVSNSSADSGCVVNSSFADSASVVSSDENVHNFEAVGTAPSHNQCLSQQPLASNQSGVTNVLIQA